MDTELVPPALITPPAGALVSLDIETTGLDPHKDEIVAIGLYVDGTPYIFDDIQSDMFKKLIANQLRYLYENHELLIHNAAFDLVWLSTKFKIGFPKRVYDTMIAERLCTAGTDESVSLLYTAYRRCGAEIDKALQTSFKLGEPLTVEQRAYLRQDLEHLHKIREEQLKQIEREHLQTVWEIEQSVTPVFCQMIADGIKVNYERITNLLKEEQIKLDHIAGQIVGELTPLIMYQRINKRNQMQDKLDEWLQALDAETKKYELQWQDELVKCGSLFPEPPPEWVENKWCDETIDPKDNAPKGQKRYVAHHLKGWRAANKRPPKPFLDDSEINLGSHKQMVECWQRLGINTTTTSAKALKRLLPTISEDNTRRIVELYIEHAKHAKILAAFGESLLQFLDEQGYLHGQFKQYGTDTGRPSCEKPNLLQMPSRDEFRSCFIAPPNHLFVVCDYAQMELRLMAQLSKDPVMLKAFNDGLDLHTNTASLMYNVPYDDVTEKQRKIAKTINFGTLYGMGPGKLQETLGSDGVIISFEEAEAALKAWRTAYRIAAQAIDQWGHWGVSQGFTTTALGRRRRFEVTAEMNRWEVQGVARQAANFVIQGSNADITKLAMVVITRLCEEEYIDAAVVLNVYDEIVVEVAAKHALRAAQIVQSAMLASAEQVLTDVPAKVDCVISPSWNEKEAIHRL